MFALKIAGVLLTAAMAFAQAPQTAPRPGRHVGVVKKIDANSRQLTIMADAGGEKNVRLLPDASLLRVAPGEKDLSKATKITLGDIQPGDRVLVRATTTESETLEATTVVVMSQSDLARKQEAERAEWRRRGISGKVTAVDVESGEITVTVPAANATTLSLKLGSGAVQRRYRPGSVRFNDAQPSTLAEVKVGDQIHALGARDESQGTFIAEQIVTGSFRNLAAVVSSVDAAQQVVLAKDVETKKPLRIRIGAESILRRLPPEFIQRMAMRGQAGNGGPNMPMGSGQGAQARPNGPEAPSADGPRRPLDLALVRDRFPAAALEELNSGDAIILSTSDDATSTAINAIVVLAGADALLREPAATQRELLGSWNLSAGSELP